MNEQSKIKEPQVLPANDNKSAQYKVSIKTQAILTDAIDFYQCIDSEGATPNYVLGYN